MFTEKNSHKKSIKKLLLFFLFVFATVTISLTTPKTTKANNWITSCNISHSATIDPIVFPGSLTASHLHDFMGARTTGPNSTAQSLFAGGTTCLTNGDHSAYWVPALYRQGSIRTLPGGTSKHLLAYYISQGGNVQPFPFGLRMIIGNARATSESQNTHLTSGRIQYRCGPGSGSAESNSPPASCGSGIMAPVFTFPSCWDGRNLDSADHISHMAYGGSSCPSSHPVKVPMLKVFIRYGVGSGTIPPVNLSSGPYYTAHIDFFNAWHPGALQQLIDRCLNGGGGSCGQNPVVNIGGATIPPTMGGSTMAPTMRPSMTPPISGMRQGDANGDGRVNILDFTILSNNFGNTVSGGPSMGDFDRNGVVNIIDFQILASNWTG